MTSIYIANQQKLVTVDRSRIRAAVRAAVAGELAGERPDQRGRGG